MCIIVAFNSEMILFSFKSTFFLLLSALLGRFWMASQLVGRFLVLLQKGRNLLQTNTNPIHSSVRGCISKTQNIHIVLDKLTQHTHFLQRLILNAYEEEAHAKEEAFFKFFQKLLLEDENFVGQLQPQEQQGVSSEVS